MLIKGNVSGEPDRPELHADEIVRLADAWTQRTSRLSVVVDAEVADASRLASLRGVLDLVPGPVPVCLELRLPGGAEAVFDLPRHKVRVTEELVLEARRHLRNGGRAMPRRMSRIGIAVLLAGLALIAGPARALEPVNVTSEGVVAAGPAGEAPPRDAAFQAALVSAVLEASRALIPPERFELETERLRGELAPRAQGFVLTYRVGGALARRPSALDPQVQEWVLPVTARIDTNQLRAFLVRTGFIREAGERPSVVIRVRPVGALATAPPVGALSHLTQSVRAKLESQQFVVVDAGLRPGEETEPRSALELARGVGADVGLELDVDWRPNPAAAGSSGGVAEVRARALRSDDGSELAIARFEAAGYDPLRDEALARALLAVEPQLGENLGQQLERNWQAQTPSERPVALELEAVSSLVQVNAVQRALKGSLAASSAELRELRPGGATLEVVSSLSAGALQERLASLPFEGFALLPVEAGRRTGAAARRAGPGNSRGTRARPREN